MAKKATVKKATPKENDKMARRIAVLKAANSIKNFKSLLDKLPNENEAFIRRTLTTARKKGLQIPVLEGEIRPASQKKATELEIWQNLAKVAGVEFDIKHFQRRKPRTKPEDK